MGERVAAIDCGTNSTRLLVADADGTPVERLMRITRLGQAVAAGGRLLPEGIDRTVAVLREFRGVMDDLGVDRVRMTATSAARDASNRDEFFDAAAEVVGSRPELITGAEEAELSFAGATSDLDAADGPFLVVDIGGGSTELAVGSDRVDGARSIDVGSVRLSETWLHSDPPLPEELHACISITRQHLDDVVREVPRMLDAARFVGLAGTVTTVAAVEMGLRVYDRDAIHHFVLTRAASEDVFRTLATESLEDRKANPGLEAGRADVIVAGCCILQAIMRYFDFAECLVSEDDILHGLVLSLLD